MNPTRSRTAGPAAGRHGAALLIAILTVLVVMLLASALLSVAKQHRFVSRAGGETVRARSAAESAARLAAAEWTGSAARELGPGERRGLGQGALPDGTLHGAEVERLDSATVLIRAWGGTPTGGAQARAGLLVRTLQPLAAAAGFPAALTSAGPVTVRAGSVVDGTPADPPPPWTPADCAPEPPLELSGTGLLVAADDEAMVSPDADLAGTPPLRTDAALVAAIAGRLGWLRVADVAELADRSESGAISIGPNVGGGSCNAVTPGNWGAPSDREGPCGEYFPLIHAPADLEVAAGEGQGVLVVDGDLYLGASVRFYGLIIVRGRFTAAPGAAVLGAVRLEGAGPHLIDGAAVGASPCALRRALLGAPALNRPFLPRSRAWVPLF